MSTIDLYGIPNCDTVKKARRWLEEHQLAYRFHDFKKSPPDAEQLQRWLDAVGMDTLINRRGTTWRQLDDASKTNLDETRAIALMQAHTSIIKRPVLVTDMHTAVGFAAADYEQWLLNQ